MAKALDVGDRAPDFELPGPGGRPVSLAALRAQGPVVVFFYPKDNTPGCTRQVCAFRDHFADFVAAGAQVVGISRDEVASHAAFAGQHGLTYPLLSDDRGAVAQRFGVSKMLGLMPGRVTFVVDRDGVVRHRCSGQLQIRRHIDAALAMVRELKAAAR